MNEPRFAELPIVMAEIAEVAGLSAAWEIVRAMGGREVYIPAKVPADHWLVELVGIAAAEKICSHYAMNGSGHRLLIPMAKQAVQSQRMVKALESGMSAPDAASAAGMHVRTAYRYRGRMKKTDKDQGNLF